MLNSHVSPHTQIREAIVENFASNRPRVILVSILPFMFSARLAIGLEQVGFVVGVICPERHPIRHLQHLPWHRPLGLMGANTLGPFGARARISAAIKDFQADIAVACDDQAARVLRGLAQTGSSSIKRLLQASFGPSKFYPLLGSKTAQVKLARELDIRTPPFVVVSQVSLLGKALEDVGLPAFLKRDETWAGQGVVEVTTEAGAAAAWKYLARMHTWFSALSVVRAQGWRHSAAGIRARQPPIHLQRLIAGIPANRSVVCKDGEVIAGLSVLAIETSSGTGPATVVRPIENSEMTQVTARIARHFCANGFLGFDFVISASGEAFFLEVNARATPIAALSLVGSDDLLGALFGTISRIRPVQRSSSHAETIALFPEELVRDSASRHLTTAYHDVPHGEPALTAFGMRHVRDR